MNFRSIHHHNGVAAGIAATALCGLMLAGCGEAPSQAPTEANDLSAVARARVLCEEHAHESLPEGFTSLVEAYPTTMAGFHSWERSFLARQDVAPGPRVTGRPDTEFTALCVYEGTDEHGEPAVVPKAPPGAERPEHSRAVVLVSEGGVSVLWAAGRADNLPIRESPPPTP